MNRFPRFVLITQLDSQVDFILLHSNREPLIGWQLVHSPGKMPAMADALRYVVLRHDQVDEPHYDLMLERTVGGALATWRLSHWPPEPGDSPEPIADHRPAYLDYQGPVSGNRGQVRRVAQGHYQSIQADDSMQWRVRMDSGLEMILPVRS